MARTACALAHMHTRTRTDSPSNAAFTCAQDRQISFCARFAGLWFSSPVVTFLLGPPGLLPSSSAPLSLLRLGREEAAAEVGPAHPTRAELWEKAGTAGLASGLRPVCFPLAP